MTHGAQIYFETGGNGKLFLCEKQYTGKTGNIFVKRTLVDEHWQPVKNALSKEDMKCKSNSVYGKVVSDTMRKDYIVTHKDGKIGIVFKHTVVAVFQTPYDDCATQIELNNDTTLYVNDAYETIVKAVLS